MKASSKQHGQNHEPRNHHRIQTNERPSQIHRHNNEQPSQNHRQNNEKQAKTIAKPMKNKTNIEHTLTQ